MNEVQKSIISTLVYSDLFEFPLTKKEVWQYAIKGKGILLQKKVLFTNLEKNSSFYYRENDYYFLKDKEYLVDTRLKRQKIAEEKLSIAEKIIKSLSYIPSVQFIGISGSLAMLNTTEEDDIDLFIITRKKTIWVTRLLTLVILEINGKRRHRNEKRVKNKICVNMFLDETTLAFPKTWQDLYTAHEIVQLKPLFDRSNMYERFIRENLWVRNYLPNSIDTRILRDYDIGRNETESPNILVSCYLSILKGAEFIAKKLQLWYMKKPSQSEIISDDILAFYEGNTRKRVLREYEMRLKKYKISNI